MVKPKLIARFGCLGLIILTPLLAPGCGTGSPAPMSTPTPPPGGRTLADFEFLRLGMSYEEVVEDVGPADRLEGSGMTGYSYDLGDGSKLSLNFGPTGNGLARVLLLHADGTREILLGGPSSQLIQRAAREAGASSTSVS